MPIKCKSPKKRSPRKKCRSPKKCSRGKNLKGSCKKKPGPKKGSRRMCVTRTTSRSRYRPCSPYKQNTCGVINPDCVYQNNRCVLKPNIYYNDNMLDLAYEEAKFLQHQADYEDFLMRKQLCDKYKNNQSNRYANLRATHRPVNNFTSKATQADDSLNFISLTDKLITPRNFVNTKETATNT